VPEAVVDEVTLALCLFTRTGNAAGSVVSGVDTMTSDPDPCEKAAHLMTSPADRVTVVVYSQLDAVRAQVRSAVGRRPEPELPRIDWVECSTFAQVLAALDTGDVDLAILDGEAQPTGGMGLARQFKFELADCPPIAVLIARAQDGWLASWSLADAVITRPIDPVTSGRTVADLLRKRLSGVPVVR
jgi:hypothetical protein